MYQLFATKKEAGVLDVMEWPPQSPDLNPIELLWEELDRRVRDLKPTSLPNLWDCCSDLRDTILILNETKGKMYSKE